MPRRTGSTPPRQVPTLTEQLLLPMARVEVLTRVLLREFVIDAGLEKVSELFAQEAERLAGQKGRRRPDRSAYRWGTTSAELVLGGRKVVLPRPRVRSIDGHELALPSVSLFSNRDPLSERVVEQILLGVSTRRYDRSLEPLGMDAKSRGTSKSAVSRTFVQATQGRVQEELSRPLGELDVAVLMLDGLLVKSRSVVVALAVTVDGVKHVLGIRQGSSENAAVCTELLQDLLGRGLKISRPLLCVVDGAAGLRRALQDVFGAHVLLQRCQLHKMRNVRDHLPKKAQGWVLAQMREAYKAPGAEAARRQLQRLATSLQRSGHDEAAASLREGLEETLTVLKLRLPTALTRSLSTTNAIENLMSQIRRTTRRVSRWRSDSMVRRWVGMSVVEAKKRFHRLKGYRELPILLAALERLHGPSVAHAIDAA